MPHLNVPFSVTRTSLLPKSNRLFALEVSRCVSFKDFAVQLEKQAESPPDTFVLQSLCFAVVD